MPEDLRHWLQRIGLEQLAETFAANDVDLDVLPDLADKDLKELGLSIGHRRRLLRAVADLPREPPPTAEAVTSSGDKGREAERRQLTVLFSSDLVGSDRVCLAGTTRRICASCCGAITMS